MVVLGSLCGEITQEDLQPFVVRAVESNQNFIGAVPREMYEPFVRPILSALCTMWRTPRGHEFARTVAYQDVPLANYTKRPMTLLLVEIVRREAVSGTFTAEEEALVWKAAEDTVDSVALGRFPMGTRQLIQLALAWNGGTGLLGWGGFRASIEEKLRGPGDYFIGRRYLQLGKTSEAAYVFNQGLAQAPPDSPVRRLLQAEVDKLAKQKSPN